MEKELKTITSEELLEFHAKVDDFATFLERERETNEEDMIERKEREENE